MKLGQYIIDEESWELEQFSDFKDNFHFWTKRYIVYKTKNLSSRFLRNENEGDYYRIIDNIEESKNMYKIKELVNELARIGAKGSKSYFIAIFRFYLFLVKVEASSIKKIENKVIKAFANFLGTKDAKLDENSPAQLSDATKENIIIRVKNFIKFINEHNITNNGESSYNINITVENKDLVKKRTKTVEIISPDKEYSEFLAGVNEIEFKFNNIRNKLLLKIALFTGMRVSEITHLKFKDIEIDGRQFAFHIVGKGNKERTLYVNKKDIQSLWVALLRERKNRDPEDYVFANRYGRPLADRTVSNFVRRVLDFKGIKSTKTGLHLIRHSLSTKLIFSGEHTLEDVSALLGHEDISTTQIYTHITNEHIKKTSKGISSVLNKK